MTTTEARAEYALMPDAAHTGVQVIEPRLVPLGGPRAMRVRRTLPHRDRSFVGAWCFVDHYGPDDVSLTGGMNVPPHPHTGLQTVTWLFEGEIEHRDSSGAHAIVRPGEVNLMTGGYGICHSEVSTTATSKLHGVQLWVALPDSDRHAPRAFQHDRAVHFEPVPGAHMKLFIGEFAGREASIDAHTPLLAAEVHFDAGTVTLPLNPAHEHGLLVDQGTVEFAGASLEPGELGIIEAGHTEVTVTAHEPTRAMLIGGAPFEEEIIMWWNFIGRTHDEIVAFRDEWQAHSDRFGAVEGYEGPMQRLPAPEMPGVRLRPRRRMGRG